MSRARSISLIQNRPNRRMRPVVLDSHSDVVLAELQGLAGQLVETGDVDPLTPVVEKDSTQFWAENPLLQSRPSACDDWRDRSNAALFKRERERSPEFRQPKERHPQGLWNRVDETNFRFPRDFRHPEVELRAPLNHGFDKVMRDWAQAELRWVKDGKYRSWDVLIRIQSILLLAARDADRGSVPLQQGRQIDDKTAHWRANSFTRKARSEATDSWPESIAIISFLSFLPNIRRP